LNRQEDEMNVRCIALVAAACCLAVGCRRDPYLNTHIELLNAEKLALEDRVYELEYAFEKKASELERLQKENEQLRQGGGARSVPTPSVDRSPPPGATDMVPPTVELPDDDLNLDLSPPTIVPGVQGEPTIELPGMPESSSRAPRREAPGRAFTMDPRDPQIASIDIDPRMTGGTQLDQQPGDDAITVVFAPRNEDRSFVPLAGPVSVALLDPAEQGERQYFAQWDLDAKQVDQQMRASPNREAIRLTLPWPDAPPRHRHLHLFVRYVTVDGRKLEADVEVEVEPAAPGSYAQRWSNRSSASREPHGGPATDADQPPVNIARPRWSPIR
jgi:hypothetical protein